ncbi:DUF6777 domain-containing protein [Streptomyces sp. N502]|uniref:DUF6777 domain-containing protein n=1 Tax=Streptomyces sp. N502 TaxID=2730916 RepID=UPI001F0D7619|nr:DUF6777 domain-containing protein [Streptomyces sp. N502]
MTAITALVAAVGLTVFLTRPVGGPAQASEVILQPTNATGPDPYTQSTANTTSSLPAAAPNTPPTKPNAIRSVAGSEPGLYGGSHNTASCDVEKQIRYLTSDKAKNKAFASVLSIPESAVPGYLRSLTPVQLRSDTRVTNHGYRDGASTSYQAVLQAGTAVLVDGYGEPKVRCACGNPLSRAVAQTGTPQQKGTAWPGYQPEKVVVVNRSATEMKEFVIFDAKDQDWVRRHSGDNGERDKKTAPPPKHWPLPATQSPPANEPPDTKPEKKDRDTKPGGDDRETKPEKDPDTKPNKDDPETKPDKDPDTKPNKDDPETKPDKDPDTKPNDDTPQPKPENNNPEPKPTPSSRPSTTAAVCASTKSSATSPRPRPGSDTSTPLRRNDHVSEITGKLQTCSPSGPRPCTWGRRTTAGSSIRQRRCASSSQGLTPAGRQSH